PREAQGVQKRCRPRRSARSEAQTRGAERTGAFESAIPPASLGPTRSLDRRGYLSILNRLFRPIKGWRVLPPSTARAALRPPDSLLLRESPSARTRGLRPASPALALRLSPTLSPAKGRFPQEAMSEGARAVKSFA